MWPTNVPMTADRRRTMMPDKLTHDGLKRLQEVARRHVGDDLVPGLVYLVACGEQVYAEALGTLSVGGAPVADLLPELAGRRVLTRMDGPLDDTVPARRPITTRDLLTFIFGFAMVTEMFFAPAPWPVVAAT